MLSRIIEWIVNNDLLKALTNLMISLSSLIISIIALVYTIKTYILKEGLKIRASYSYTSSLEASDIYVSSVTIENLKDKALIVYKICLKLGRNTYIELEDFMENPLIISPFEIYHKNYDPIIYYYSNGRVLKIDKLLENRKIKKQIVLSTSEGKKIIKEQIKKWEIRIDTLKFPIFLGIPIRNKIDGISYGINILYLVRLEKKDKKWTVPIYKEGYKYKWLNNLYITENSIKTKEGIENSFLEAKKNKKIDFDSIEIVEYKKDTEELYEIANKEIIESEELSFVEYYYIIFMCYLKPKYLNFNWWIRSVKLHFHQ